MDDHSNPDTEIQQELLTLMTEYGRKKLGEDVEYDQLADLAAKALGRFLGGMSAVSGDRMNTRPEAELGRLLKISEENAIATFQAVQNLVRDSQT